MSLVEHLAELRTRVFRALLAVGLGTVLGYIVFEQVFDVLIKPYCDVPTAFRTATGDCALVASRALEAFSTRIKTSVIIGLFLGGPVLFYQLWRFITPGLTDSERRYALPFVVGSQVMFALGIGFAYLVIPQGLRILLGMGGDNITPLLTASEYLSFFTRTVIAFGLVFEIPLILVFLSLVGLVTAAGLRRFRPYAIVLNVTLAAIITPSTDAITLMFLAGPMIVFYEASILAAWLIQRRRARRASPL
jgi:sec-independent protein translocase protein TatC